MLYTFTLHEDAWLRDGPVYAGGPVIGYRVAECQMGRLRESRTSGHRIGTTGASCESTPTTHTPIGPAIMKASKTHWRPYSRIRNESRRQSKRNSPRGL